MCPASRCSRVALVQPTKLAQIARSVTNQTRCETGQMSNPILVEVTRGALVESHHRGAACVIDAAGTTVLAVGDVATPIFPRSAVKAIQALVLVESGAADRYGFGDEELALACASHAGEPAHGERL